MKCLAKLDSLLYQQENNNRVRMCDHEAKFSSAESIEIRCMSYFKIRMSKALRHEGKNNERPVNEPKKSDFITFIQAIAK